jgi:choline dehydrogenase-like flavoprotein
VLIGYGYTIIIGVTQGKDGMIKYHSEVPSAEILKADLCIIGAGPAGMTLAHELESQNVRVIMLESGGLAADEATQSLCDGPASESAYPYRLRFRQFGGSSNGWGAVIEGESLGVRYAMMDEIDFERRDGIPYTGWPFLRSHLEPYYRRAQRFLRIAPFDVSRWENADNAHPLEFQGGGITTTVVQFGPRDVFLKECREKLASSTRIDVYLNLNAVAIESNENGSLATRVRVVSLDGKQLLVEAKTFILATGGIENARLLLLSDGIVKSGLGNQHDLVGRFFIDHYGHFGGILHPAERSVFERMALYDLRCVAGVSAMGILVLTPDLMREQQLLNTATYLVPRSRTYPHRRSANAARKLLVAKLTKRPWLYDRPPDRPRAATDLLRRMVLGYIADFPDRLHRKFFVGRPYPWTSINEGGWSRSAHKDQDFAVIEIQQLFEQVPDPENRVMLSDELDVLGCRKAKVERRLSPIDIESLRRTNLILRDAFARSGLGRFVVDNDLTTPEFTSVWHGASHHMGTTRMHDDPKQGVVDSNCKVHGVANLYIAGSSVFPTGGYANPTLTIVAMTLRLADHLKAVSMI